MAFLTKSDAGLKVASLLRACCGAFLLREPFFISYGRDKFDDSACFKIAPFLLITLTIVMMLLKSE